MGLVRHLAVGIGFLLLAGALERASADQTGTAASPPKSPEQGLVAEAERLLDSPTRTPLDLAEVQRKARQAISINANDPHAYLVLARYYEISGSVSRDDYRPGALDSAISAIDDAIKADPTFSEAYVYGAFLYTQAFRLAEAQTFLDKARALGSRSEWLDVNQAHLFIRQKRLTEAEQLLAGVLPRTLENRRARRYAYDQLMFAYSLDGNEAKAKAVYVAGAKAFPADPGIPGVFAEDVMEYFGDFEEGISRAREAVGLSNEATARLTLGLALYGKWATLLLGGHAADAAPLFEEAQAYYPAIVAAQDPRLSAPKLQIITEAFRQVGLVDAAGHIQFWRYLSYSMLQRHGLDQWPWPVWASIFAALAIATVMFERRLRLLAAPAAAPAKVPAAEAAAQVDAAAAAPAAPRPIEQFRFTGSGSEYFRIWIVNLLLTVLTLGIYSAWAKVRRLKYFYRNTELAGSRFDYHGDPVAILKGRLAAVGLLVAYRYSFSVSNLVGYLTFALLAILVPWLIRSSMRFRLRNSSYRGVRFSFKGALGLAYYVFFIGVLGTLASLWTLGPFFHQRMKRYQHGNSYYGHIPSSFWASPWNFYGLYLRGLGVLLGSAFLLGIFIAIVVPLVSHVSAASKDATTVAVFTGVFAFYLGFVLMVVPYLNSRTQNLIWNHTALGGHRFESTLTARRLCWIYSSNLVGVLLTAGLFWPWASMRLARYKAESLTLVPASDLTDVVAGAEAETGAAGQEATELFDIDISF